MKSESVSVLLVCFTSCITSTHARTHTRLTQMIYEEFHSAPVKPDLAWGVNTRKSTVSSLRAASCRRKWLLSARKPETVSRVAITLTSPLRACCSRPAFHEPWIMRCSISKCKYLGPVSPAAWPRSCSRKSRGYSATRTRPPRTWKPRWSTLLISSCFVSVVSDRS